MNLESRIADELQSIYERLDRNGELLSSIQLDAALQTFRTRFGPDKLGPLDGEELLYAMHSRGDHHGLMYWLEFKNDDEFRGPIFGTIGGGSAHNYTIYYSKERQSWIGGTVQRPVRISIEQAIAVAQRQRDELIQGARLLEELPDDQTNGDYLDLQSNMDRVAGEVGNSSWGHKYFSLLYPTKLDDFHNPAYQRFHLIRLLQTPAALDGRYICGGQFVAIANHLDMRMNHLTQCISERNGRTPFQYWRVGTREGDDGDSYWSQMKNGSYIAIGWAGTPDLSYIKTIPENAERKNEIKRLLPMHWSHKYADEIAKGNAAGHIHRFLMDVHERDLILAADGAMVLGIGRVKGPYYFADDDRFAHRLPVDWLTFDEWRMPELEQIRNTVARLGKYANNLIEAEKRILNMPVQPSRLASVLCPQPPTLTGILAKIEGILTRKGQVILYGPPGTGKTHWAEIAARELAARSWYQKTFDQLSYTEEVAIVGSAQSPASAVRMCGFHPAYGYEDFLEGYRPHTSEGQMAFELRDGIFKHLCADAFAHADRNFYLVIDEINRGDIPRIFGELLTVMERNKRGKPILLPLTGTAFAVPPNVYIIGTMNTADRSIALLDAALRRRFGFIELMPDSEVIGDAHIEGFPLRRWFEEVNKSVIAHVGRDGRNLQIGHSYLLTHSGQPISDHANFVRVLSEDIIPLLQEYCYEDYAALERILGDGLIDTTKQSIKSELFELDRRDDLIVALLSNHTELSAYIVPVEAMDEDETVEGDADAAAMLGPETLA